MTKAIILLPFFILAACDSGPSITATNASIAEVATKVEAARQDKDFLRPGKWLTKATLEELSAPGMSAEVANNMKLTMASRTGSETCLTEADARKPKGDFFAPRIGNCRYDHYTMGIGKIDAQMRCPAGDRTQLMTMAGEYSPDEYHMRMTTQMDTGRAAAENGVGLLTMKMRVEGKRIGDCDAGASASNVAAKESVQ